MMFLSEIFVICFSGTTLDLVRFPIIKPTPWRLNERYKRLKLQKLEERELLALNHSKLVSTGQSKYATLMGENMLL